MADLPALSDSTKRKFAVQWETIRDNQKLTEEHLSGYDLGRQWLLGILAKPPHGMNLGGLNIGRNTSEDRRRAANWLGLDLSVKAAERRFREIDHEYWLHWHSSGGPYETYAAWLDSLKCDIVAELASIWKGRSDVTDLWSGAKCAPVIEKALASLVKKRIAQARDAETKRLANLSLKAQMGTGNPVADEPPAIDTARGGFLNGITEGAMEPLIELPLEAKARIKAREAEAEKQFDSVRRAFEGELAKAESDWGGYFDLHQDELRQERERVRAGLDEMLIVCAEYVYVAHATEYRAVLHDRGDLEPLFAKLREAIVQRYGEHTRAAVQCKETQQMEKALADGKTEPEVADESEAPIVVGDAQFWRARRDDFREYNTNETASLSADWDSMTGNWTLRGSAEAQTVFKSLATIAAKGFQSYDQEEPWKSWLNELRRRRRNYTETATTAAYSQRALEDPSKFGIEAPTVIGELRTGTVDQNEMAELWGSEVAQRAERTFAQVRFKGIHGIAKRVFETSANVCLEFEAKTATPPGSRGGAVETKAASSPAVGEVLVERPRALDPEQLKTRRERVLTAAQERWRPIAKRIIPFAWIHKAAGVDHKDAYDWKNGKLADSSTMTQNLERILQLPHPPSPPITE